MNAPFTALWDEANQRYLLTALNLVRQALEAHNAHDHDLETRAEHTRRLQRELEDVATLLPGPTAVARLCTSFGLSPFERDLLLLCAGVELDSGFRRLCSQMSGPDPDEQGSVPFVAPTFSLALATLPDAHWDALTPGAPLRFWRLIAMRNGPTLALSPLRIDEPILHYLAGLPYQDERLYTPGYLAPEAGELVPSHHALAQRLLAAWQGQPSLPTLHSQASSLPVIQLCGPDSVSKQAIASYACQQVHLRLHILPVDALPSAASEIELLARLWEREAVLGTRILLLDCEELDAGEKHVGRTLNTLLQQINAPVILTSREHTHWLRLPRPLVTLEVEAPGSGEQLRLWQQELAPLNLTVNGHIERLAMQFSLNSTDIRAASARLHSAVAQDESQSQGDLLWEACRVQARPALEHLAQRIDPRADWADLVLPEAQQQLLHEIVTHVRQRVIVYDTWGFGGKSARGLGISALFAGASGTGKTLAAEVLATTLRLDLYRVDLSAVVSKYIGETEKNLRQIFDAAEKGGAILLFDEADALFGKRSEVKDSHDRYANIEVSYLLQRMETHRGLAILTTNLKSNLDSAFLRRLRFIVHFPFPDIAMRAEIWRRIFPTALPTEGLEVEKLARLHIAGGNIHSIALYAAFLAADAGEPVRMTHLLRAAATEYAKLEKPLTEAEIGGWIDTEEH